MSISSLFLARFPAIAIPGELKEGECVLAAARVFVAAGSVVALYFDPEVPVRYAPIAHGAFFVYLTYSILIFAAFRTRTEPSPVFCRAIHSVDTLWAPVVFLLAGGPGALSLVWSLFALLAAAYRWSFWQAVVTAGSIMGLLVIEPTLVTFGRAGTLHPAGAEDQYGSHFIAWTTCWLILGGLFGYLTEKERQLHKQTLIVSRITSETSLETGTRGAVERVLRAFIELFGAHQVTLALQDKVSSRAFLWEAERLSGEERIPIQLSELTPPAEKTYFFEAPGEGWCLTRTRRAAGGSLRLLALSSEGQRLCNVSFSLPEFFLTKRRFKSLLAVSFTLGEEWSGRVFLFDPSLGSHREAKLRFLQDSVRQIVPAVHSVYRLRRLRSRAGTLERARVARELHDGVIQSLIIAEMHVDVVRRHAANDPARILEQLAEVQGVLHCEIVNARELMQQLKPVDLDSRQLLGSLADIVDQFRRQTGIAAKFDSDIQEIALPPRVCREVARILQEALINVRKHSQARSVLVHFGRDNGSWKLLIGDDGRGFDFSGCLSQVELDRVRKGPRVIKERVRSIGGQLAVDSMPGRGARLEITLPRVC